MSASGPVVSVCDYMMFIIILWLSYVVPKMRVLLLQLQFSAVSDFDIGCFTRLFHCLLAGDLSYE